MNFRQRVENSLKYGGIKELIRKAWYAGCYGMHNMQTKAYVEKAEVKNGLWKGEARKVPVVVSMTTFPPRFAKIGMVIKSLLCQDYKPDRIVIYLDGKTTYEDLTEEMKGFEKYGVEYRFHNEILLKSHSKYFFAMQEFPEAIIVTTDDDVIVPRDWLSSLMDTYQKYPGAVCSRRVHLMRYDEKGFLPYNHWYDQWRGIKKPSHLLIATGVGGVLYPPHCLPAEAFDEQRIRELALNADDIWLKCWEVMGNIPVVWAANQEVSLLETEAEHEIALSNSNVNESQNDIILNKVLEYYHLSVSDFLRDGV